MFLVHSPFDKYYGSARGIWRADGSGAILVQYLNKEHNVLQLETRADFHAIFFFEERGWAVGTRGTIFTTADGGATWKRQNSQIRTDLLAIACGSASHCTAVGKAGLILTTRDAGHHWRALKLDEGEPSLNAIQFLDSQNGWIVGDGTVLRTEDGGETWVALHCPTMSRQREANYNSVIFLDTLHGCVASGNKVSCSSDGGSTWRETGAVRNAIVGFVAQNAHIVAVTACGPDYESRDLGLTWLVKDSKQDER